jgi:predicted S18 family serine protease
VGILKKIMGYERSVIINDILKNVASLPLDQQDFLAGTIRKRMGELRRNQIVKRAKEAECSYNAGNVESGSADDLMRKSENG